MPPEKKGYKKEKKKKKLKDIKVLGKFQEREKETNALNVDKMKKITCCLNCTGRKKRRYLINMRKSIHRVKQCGAWLGF